MSFIIKLSLGLYVLSVLTFSSWSRALDVSPATYSQQSQSSFAAVALQRALPVLQTANTEGFIYEDNGYLFFQTESGQLLLVHSNSFGFFEDIELPAKVSVFGTTIQRVPSAWNQTDVVQINDVSFLDL